MSAPMVFNLVGRNPDFSPPILTNPVGKVVDPLGWLTRWARGVESTPAGNPGFAVAV
jgi:hypothetical protein